MNHMQQPSKSDNTPQDQSPDILQTIMTISEAVGDEFRSLLVNHLSRDLHIDCVLIGKLNEDGQSMTIIEIASPGNIQPGATYSLEGMPCRHVIEKQECVIHADRVRRLFPGPNLLTDLGMEGYIGHPILGAYGSPLGLLAFMDRNPLEEVAFKKMLLESFSTRAAREIEREHAEIELLHASEDIDLFSTSLKQLHRLKSMYYNKFDDQLMDYLETGCELFDLSIGLISQVESEKVTIRATNAEFDFLKTGSVFALEDTYCKEVINGNKTVTIDCRNSSLPGAYQGQFKPASFLCTPISKNEKIYGTLGFACLEKRKEFRDHELEIIELMSFNLAAEIERREAEEELRASEKALRASTRELKEKNRMLETTLHQIHEMQSQLIMQEKMASLGDLVAGITHELNTPIGAINSMYDTLTRAVEKLQVLMEDRALQTLSDDRNFQTIFKAIGDASWGMASGMERVTTIVRSLQNFVRLDEAEIRIVDIHEGLESTLTLLATQIDDGVEIVKNYADIRPFSCSPEQLNQVFMHLMKNALQAVESKGKIEIRTFVNQGTVSIQISDNGVGIPPEQLERIFDFSFNATDSRVKMGFGLPTAYKIVQEHKGDIKIVSEVGKGTEVTVNLPVNPVST